MSDQKFEIYYDQKGCLHVERNGKPENITNGPRFANGIITLWENATSYLYAFGTARPDLISHRSDWEAKKTYPFVEVEKNF
jgi:hypothetical protein